MPCAAVHARRVHTDENLVPVDGRRHRFGVSQHVGVAVADSKDGPHGHQTWANEDGSLGRGGISRTTGVTKTWTLGGTVLTCGAWSLWEVKVIMDQASAETIVTTSGWHPELRRPSRPPARPRPASWRRACGTCCGCGSRPSSGSGTAGRRFLRWS